MVLSVNFDSEGYVYDILDRHTTNAGTWRNITALNTHTDFGSTLRWPRLPTLETFLQYLARLTVQMNGTTRCRAEWQNYHQQMPTKS